MFAFAVLFNDRVYDSPELRKPLQEELWGGMFNRYSKYTRMKESNAKKRQHDESLWGPEDQT